jgi:hypothetical protein
VKKREGSLRNLWDTIKQTNVYIYGNSRKKGREGRKGERERDYMSK